jgi:hypothetical protein
MAHDGATEFGTSSPGALNPFENACLGDARAGTARNPLRDGTLPTGAFEQMQEQRGFGHIAARSDQKSTKPVFSLHRGSGQQTATWMRSASVIPTLRGFGIRQDGAIHSAKTLESSGKLFSSRDLECDEL